MTQHALIIAAMVIGVWLAADIAALIWLRQLAGYGDSYRLNHSKSRSRRASSETQVDNPTQA